MTHPGKALTVSAIGVAFCLTTNAALNENCGAIATFAEDKAPLREIFVSSAGKDTTGDGSRENPYTSLSRAWQIVQPGDAIRLLPGLYEEGFYLSDHSGTAAKPIRLGGLPGADRPVLAGENQALHLVRVRYLVVENLEIAGAAQNGINCDDGGDYANPDATRHLVFRNLYFHDIGSGGNQDALKLSGVDDFFVLDCRFERTSAGGSGIDHVGCHGGLIARCTFEDMGSNAIQCKGGSKNIEIRQNYFQNAGQRAINIGGSTGFQFFRPPLSPTVPNAEARNIRVFANLFQGGITPISYVGAVDSVVAHNTIVNPENWILRILQETTSTETYTFLPSGENTFVNNLVSYRRNQISTHVNIGPNTNPDTFEFAGNFWFAVDDPDRSQPRLPAPEQNGISGQNPNFLSPETDNFDLPLDSPAVGQGVRRNQPRADLEGRCYADPPTIGAYEPTPSTRGRTRTECPPIGKTATSRIEFRTPISPSPAK